MAHDRLAVLVAVRRREVEQARQVLGACMQAEADAADRTRAIDDAAQRDRAAGRAGEEAVWFLEMSVRASQARAEDRRGAETAMVAARARSAEARTALVEARTKAEVVDTLIGQRMAAELAGMTRREQHLLDDMARSRFNADGRSAWAPGV